MTAPVIRVPTPEQASILRVMTEPMSGYAIRRALPQTVSREERSAAYGVLSAMSDLGWVVSAIGVERVTWSRTPAGDAALTAFERGVV